MTTDRPDRTQHPGLRIAVYTVDPQTMQRSPKRETSFHPEGAPPLMLSGFPPCSCPTCRRNRPVTA